MDSCCTSSQGLAENIVKIPQATCLGCLGAQTGQLSDSQHLLVFRVDFLEGLVETCIPTSCHICNVCILEAVETHSLLSGRKSRGCGEAVFGASFCDG